MTGDPPNYAYCIGGKPFLVCQRCGALVCDGAAIDLHDQFHATTVEVRHG